MAEPLAVALLACSVLASLMMFVSRSVTSTGLLAGVVTAAVALSHASSHGLRADTVIGLVVALLVPVLFTWVAKATGDVEEPPRLSPITGLLASAALIALAVSSLSLDVEALTSISIGLASIILMLTSRDLVKVVAGLHLLSEASHLWASSMGLLGVGDACVAYLVHLLVVMCLCAITITAFRALASRDVYRMRELRW